MRSFPLSAPVRYKMLPKKMSRMQAMVLTVGHLAAAPS